MRPSHPATVCFPSSLSFHKAATRPPYASQASFLFPDSACDFSDYAPPLFLTGPSCFSRLDTVFPDSPFFPAIMAAAVAAVMAVSLNT